MDIDGVIIYDTGKKETLHIFNTSVEVPVLSIKNPSDLPYSYNSLVPLVGERLEYLNDISSSDINPGYLYKFVVFDFMTDNDYYMPDRIVKEFKHCLLTTELETKYRNKNKIYTIYGKYDMSDYDMFWDSSETLIVDVGLKVDKIWFENLETDEHYFMELNDNDMFEFINELKFEDRDVFLNPVWHSCIIPNIIDYPTFFDSNWQIVDFNIIPII
jgi:hypothetical protein